eukprot:198092_1
MILKVTVSRESDLNCLNTMSHRSCGERATVPKDANGKAMAFRICVCTSVHIGTFWVTTIAFFICFFVWFGNTNLETWIAADIGLTATEKSLSKSLLTLSTIIFRVIIGDLCDKIGARYCYIFVLLSSMIPVICLAFITTSTQYIVCNFFIGIIGSSFVITEYHTTQFFADRLIGIANGTSAGWGNFGGGVAAIFMPYLASHYNISWRYLTFISASLLLIPILLYYLKTKDTPKGNVSDTNNIWTTSHLFNLTALGHTCRDYRTWIFFIIYASCFGVEITILSFMKDYLHQQFNLSLVAAGSFVFMFSSLNLFARSVGGFATDMLYRKYGIQGRVYTLCLVLIAESIFLLLFSFGGHIDLMYSLVTMLFFSFYVQCAEGITYAIVPFLGYNIAGKVGPLYGIVGAGGNFGSFLFSITLFWKLDYHHAFLILSFFVFITALLTLCVRFSPEEIRKADELLNSFLKKYNRKIYGKKRQDKLVDQRSNPPKAGIGVSVEFHIHPEPVKKDESDSRSIGKLNLVDSLKKLSNKASASLKKQPSKGTKAYGRALIDDEDNPPPRNGDNDELYQRKLKQIAAARVSEQIDE